MSSLAWFLGVSFLLLGCDRRSGSEKPETNPSAAPSILSAAPVSTGHGELDRQAPRSAPELGATKIASTIYKSPNESSRRLGYVRLGGKIRREAELLTEGAGKWFRVYPTGYASTAEFTTDLESPLIRAASRRPALSRPLPYSYGFVRATAPQYLRIPTKKEQEKSEFELAQHLAWYAEHEREVQTVVLGANDVPLDSRGVPVLGLKANTGHVLSTAMGLGRLLGGETEDDPIPFWLADNRRQIPNVSGFEVPEYAIFADRVRRKTGLSSVGSFVARDGDFSRRFVVAVDLRLIPATKIKPDTGSPFHGIELGPAAVLPFGWIVTDQAKSYQLVKEQDQVREGISLPRRALVPLTGVARIKAGRRYLQTAKDPTAWLLASDVGVVASPPSSPAAAEKGEKWIDISLRQQTLVLYEGKRPVYATLVSTGRDRLGDPKTSLATPRGEFRIRSKHIAAAMDSEENSSLSGGSRENTAQTASSDDPDTQATISRLLAAEKKKQKLSQADQLRLLNIKKGRDPEYGVTRRRGSLGFELRDVPWIQYFAAGYALHGAYWHDVFGVPRSHGCVNLSPIDARYIFFWTDPPLPEGWHGLNVGSEMGEGTVVFIRE